MRRDGGVDGPPAGLGGFEELEGPNVFVEVVGHDSGE
jgi:hypothetical protein